MQNYRNMDEYFENIFGFKPKKRGTGYEMLVGAVLKILNCSQEIRHNVKINGKYSGTPYQIDNYIEDKSNNVSIFVETKDYTTSNAPVDQKDITKLLGSLTDLDIDEGILTAATGFTNPVKRIAQSTSGNPNAKKITLYTIKPSTNKDLKGRIMQINLVLNIVLMDEENIKYRINPNKNSFDEANKRIRSKNIPLGEYELKIEEFYNQNGNPVLKVSDVFNTQNIAPMVNNVSSGTWRPDNSIYIKVFEELVLVDSIDYNIPFKIIKHEQVLRGDNPKLLVSSEDGTIDRIITEKQLKSVSFNKDGTIEYRGRY